MLDQVPCTGHPCLKVVLALLLDFDQTFTLHSNVMPVVREGCTVVGEGEDGGTAQKQCQGYTVYEGKVRKVLHGTYARDAQLGEEIMRKATQTWLIILLCHPQYNKLVQYLPAQWSLPAQQPNTIYCHSPPARRGCATWWGMKPKATSATNHSQAASHGAMRQEWAWWLRVWNPQMGGHMTATPPLLRAIPLASSARPSRTLGLRTSRTASLATAPLTTSSFPGSRCSSTCVSLRRLHVHHAPHAS
eukprot:scaffold12153_cov19-Tisochrysis_lutea.AAC.1